VTTQNTRGSIISRPGIVTVAGITDTAATILSKIRTAWRQIARVVHAVTSVVTPLGWTLIATVAVTLIGGYWFSWVELVVVGWTISTLIACAGFWLLGTAGHQVHMRLPLHRVVVGERASVEIVVSNPTRRRLPGIRIEVPVGSGIAELMSPGLSSRETFDDLFVIPTSRREVIQLGPVRTVRTDPIGILRREFVWADVLQLFVHPVTIAMPTTSSGFVRDLEGTATRDLTSSDISFHAIREYCSGDERRNIHWRSTAKTGTYMVRQFEESRRSHLMVALSCANSHYANGDEFELAVSVAGSISVRALRDTRSLSVVTNASKFAAWRDINARRQRGAPRAVHMLNTRGRAHLMDDLSRIDRSPYAQSLPDLARLAADSVLGISVAFLVCGSPLSATELRSASAYFPAGVAVIAVVCEPNASPTVRCVSEMNVMRIGYLEDLQKSLARLAR
jgi:uncharacterized protein (DUF58 family)